VDSVSGLVDSVLGVVDSVLGYPLSFILFCSLAGYCAAYTSA